MTKLLEQAIEKIRGMPEADQDLAAEILFTIASRHDAPVPLDEETRAAIERGIEQADRGALVSEEDMAAFFARHR
jgi:hypothetical protein